MILYSCKSSEQREEEPTWDEKLEVDDENKKGPNYVKMFSK
mgnify:CR=1 FL=1